MSENEINSGSPVSTATNQKPTTGVVTLRRATIADYEGVLDISRNIYDGTDFMSAFYRTYFHDNKHFGYVVEEDGVIISFSMNEIDSADNTRIKGFGRRTRPSHEGLGVGAYSRSLQDIKARFPSVNVIVGNLLNLPETQRMKDKSANLLPHTAVRYKIDRQKFLNKTMVAESSFKSVTQKLSYIHLIDRLMSTSDFEDFFRKYTDSYIICGSHWGTSAINKEELKDMFSKNQVCVTFETCETDSSQYKGIREDKPYPSITAFSCGLAYIVLNGSLMVDIHYYGPSEPLASHMAVHLNHASKICDSDFSVYVIFRQPVDVRDLKEAMRSLGLHEGETIEMKDHFDHVEVLVSI
jgi:hypothetical protein